MQLDVFKASGFDLMHQTARVNNPDVVPFVPGRLGELGLFNGEGVSTTVVAIERREGKLQLVQSRPRGSEAARIEEEGRTLRNFTVPHFPMEDRIVADEIQNIRAFGRSEAETVQEKIDQRYRIMGRDLDATLEYLRVGAVKGQILDADGSTLYDLFSEFGISQPSEINFALSTETTDVRGKCSEVIRKIEDALGNAPMEGVHGLVSSEFFDLLVNHKQVREAWARWQDGQALRERTARRTMFYGGIMFEEYRGKVGTTDFIASNKARFFPVGVPGLFPLYFAPANYISTVNTIGLPRYARLHIDPKDRWVDVDLQMNPLPICTRPESLMRAKAA